LTAHFDFSDGQKNFGKQGTSHSVLTWRLLLFYYESMKRMSIFPILAVFAAVLLTSCASQPEVSPVTEPAPVPVVVEPIPEPADEELSVEKLDASLGVSYQALTKSIPQNGRIAILGIAAEDPGVADFISQSLISLLVANRNKNGNKYSVVDRNNLELLRKEQELQTSGEVSDDTIVSLGKWLGASHVITGSLGNLQHRWTLNLRILSVETSEIVGFSDEHL
jgi:curli biogenesis system outer membrane secretion channel CsgG